MCCLKKSTNSHLICHESISSGFTAANYIKYYLSCDRLVCMRTNKKWGPKQSLRASFESLVWLLGSCKKWWAGVLHGV